MRCNIPVAVNILLVTDSYGYGGKQPGNQNSTGASPTPGLYLVYVLLVDRPAYTCQCGGVSEGTEGSTLRCSVLINVKPSCQRIRTLLESVVTPA